MKSGCAFLCDDVLGRNCIVDVFAGGVRLGLLAAASTFSVTLSRGDCLSWRKSFSGIRGCMSICRVSGDCIATSISVCGLLCSTVGDCKNTGDREDTGGDLVVSRSADVIGIILLVMLDVVVRPTVGIGVRMLGAGKKLRQSSWLSVPSICLCLSARCCVD